MNVQKVEHDTYVVSAHSSLNPSQNPSISILWLANYATEWPYLIRASIQQGIPDYIYPGCIVQKAGASVAW